MIAFYEKVLIVACADAPQYVGRYGYVLGISEEDGVQSGYAVTFETEEQVTCFEPHEVQGTGEIAPRSRFYDDTTVVHIRVDDKGRGFLAD